MKSLFLSVFLLFSFSTGYAAQIAFEGDMVWCILYTTPVSDPISFLVGMNRKDESYRVFHPSNTQVYFSALAVDHDGVKWITSNEGVFRFDGQTWKQYTVQDGLADNGVNHVTVDHDNVKWFATDGGVSRFDGEIWDTVTDASDLKGQKVLSVAVDQDNIKWIGTEFSGLYSYNGVTWSEHALSFGDTTYTEVTAIAVDAKNTKWIGAKRRWYQPMSHTEYYELALLSITDESVARHDTTIRQGADVPGDRFYSVTAGSDNSIWYQHGWYLFRYDIQSNTQIFFQSERGIQSASIDDDGVTWANTSMVVSGVNSVLKSYDGTAWKSYTFDYPTSVEDGEASPSALRIIGNHPNPFNPSTTISFTLSRAGQTRLTVYDASGQKVRELASGHLSSGAHSAVWDGRDASGRPVSSGVYFSRLESGGKVSSAKMLLMK